MNPVYDYYNLLVEVRDDPMSKSCNDCERLFTAEHKKGQELIFELQKIYQPILLFSSVNLRRKLFLNRLEAYFLILKVDRRQCIEREMISNIRENLRFLRNQGY